MNENLPNFPLKVYFRKKMTQWKTQHANAWLFKLISFFRFSNNLKIGLNQIVKTNMKSMFNPLSSHQKLRRLNFNAKYRFLNIHRHKNLINLPSKVYLVKNNSVKYSTC